MGGDFFGGFGDLGSLFGAGSAGAATGGGGGSFSPMMDPMGGMSGAGAWGGPPDTGGMPMGASTDISGGAGGTGGMGAWGGPPGSDAVGGGNLTPGGTSAPGGTQSNAGAASPTGSGGGITPASAFPAPSTSDPTAMGRALMRGAFGDPSGGGAVPGPTSWVPSGVSSGSLSQAPGIPGEAKPVQTQTIPASQTPQGPINQPAQPPPQSLDTARTVMDPKGSQEQDLMAQQTPTDQPPGQTGLSQTIASYDPKVTGGTNTDATASAAFDRAGGQPATGGTTQTATTATPPPAETSTGKPPPPTETTEKPPGTKPAAPPGTKPAAAPATTPPAQGPNPQDFIRGLINNLFGPFAPMINQLALGTMPGDMPGAQAPPAPWLQQGKAAPPGTPWWNYPQATRNAQGQWVDPRTGQPLGRQGGGRAPGPGSNRAPKTPQQGPNETPEQEEARQARERRGARGAPGTYIIGDDGKPMLVKTDEQGNPMYDEQGKPIPGTPPAEPRADTSTPEGKQQAQQRSKEIAASTDHAGNFGQPLSPTYARSRAAAVKEILGDPDKLNTVLSRMWNEQSTPQGTQGVAESFLNRYDVYKREDPNTTFWDKRISGWSSKGGYYEDGRGVHGFPESARPMLMQSFMNAANGSDITNGATDNASEGRNNFASGRMNSGMFRYQADYNGEYFLSPNSMGPQGSGHVPAYRAWEQEMYGGQNTPAAPPQPAPGPQGSIGGTPLTQVAMAGGGGAQPPPLNPYGTRQFDPGQPIPSGPNVTGTPNPDTFGAEGDVFGVPGGDQQLGGGGSFAPNPLGGPGVIMPDFTRPMIPNYLGPGPTPTNPMETPRTIPNEPGLTRPEDFPDMPAMPPREERAGLRGLTQMASLGTSDVTPIAMPYSGLDRVAAGASGGWDTNNAPISPGGGTTGGGGATGKPYTEDPPPQKGVVVAPQNRQPPSSPKKQEPPPKKADEKPKPKAKPKPKGMTPHQRRVLKARQAPPIPKLSPYGSTSDEYERSKRVGYVQPGERGYDRSMRYYYGR